MCHQCGADRSMRVPEINHSNESNSGYDSKNKLLHNDYADDPWFPHL